MHKSFHFRYASLFVIYSSRGKVTHSTFTPFGKKSNKSYDAILSQESYFPTNLKQISVFFAYTILILRYMVTLSRYIYWCTTVEQIILVVRVKEYCNNKIRLDAKVNLYSLGNLLEEEISLRKRNIGYISGFCDSSDTIVRNVFNLALFCLRSFDVET